MSFNICTLFLVEFVIEFPFEFLIVSWNLKVHFSTLYVRGCTFHVYFEQEQLFSQKPVDHHGAMADTSQDIFSDISTSTAELPSHTSQNDEAFILLV